MSAAAIDLWWVATRDVVGPDLLEMCFALLTAEERIRKSAFRFEKNQHEYLITRALGRAVLARRLAVAPRALTFTRSEYGRPELDPPALRFNLTNTVDLVACVVADGVEVGVDAEPLSRGGQILDVATVVFTRGERAALAALPLPEREQRAVRLWTSKEAYIKARGMGMSLPVEKVELDLDVAGGRLRFFEPVTDDPSRWTITTREIDDHCVATCIEGGGDVTVHHADLRAMLGD